MKDQKLYYVALLLCDLYERMMESGDNVISPTQPSGSVVRNPIKLTNFIDAVTAIEPEVKKIIIRLPYQRSALSLGQRVHRDKMKQRLEAELKIGPKHCPSCGLEGNLPGNEPSDNGDFKDGKGRIERRCIQCNEILAIWREGVWFTPLK